MSSTVQEISKLEEIILLLESDKKILIDFYAQWCTPCRAIAPFFEKLSKEHSQITFVKINIDNEKLRSFIANLRVSSIPCFYFLHNKKIHNIVTGAHKDRLKAALDDFEKAVNVEESIEEPIDVVSDSEELTKSDSEILSTPSKEILKDILE